MYLYETEINFCFPFESLFASLSSAADIVFYNVDFSSCAGLLP